jgi:single-stranded-DNA-specific exonuclease
MEVLDHLEYLEPTGYGNPSASFVSRDVKVKSFRGVGSEGKHLKISFDDECGGFFDAIGFRMGNLIPSLSPRMDILYQIELNEYNGRKSLQLNLKDIKPAGTPD